MNKSEYPKPFDPTTAIPGKLYWDRQKECRVRFVAMASANAVFEIVKGNSIIAREKDGRVFSNIHNTPDDIVIHREDDIAPGYNPLGLTNGQVGEGFRLADPAKDAFDTRAERWSVTFNSWSFTVNDTSNGYAEDLTYRIPIDLPKKRVPLDASDFPLGKLNYVRQNGRSTVFLVTGSWPGGIKYEQAFVDFSCLKKAYEYTTDNGATWKPCWKEI